MTRQVSFWRFNLSHELIALLAATSALAAGAWFSVAQLERRYLQLHQQDVDRVGSLLQEHLREARQQLEYFSALDPGQQALGAAALLPAFSDVYQLGAQHQVRGVWRASPGSRVFPGFSFATSRIRPYLDRPERQRAPSSAITRGLEDEIASVYVATGPWLARVNLLYLQAFLRRYSQRSGQPLLLVSHDGFVMLSSDAAMGVPAVDLSLAAARQSGLYRLRYGGRDWQPMVANDNGLGGHIVTLIPVDQLEQQRQLVLWPSLVVSLLALLVFLWKNRRLHSLLYAPVARFTARMEQVRSGLSDPEAQALEPAPVLSRFKEMGQIQAGFEDLMQAIRERDTALQQKLRTSLTAAAIAHEINLPLSTIRLRCQQADQQLRLGAFSPEQSRQLVQDLQAESQQVSRVIERMRMLLRNVQTELVPTDLAAVVMGALTLHKRSLREQAVQLERQGLPQEGADRCAWIVMADPAQLQMAVGNLLRNAIEALAQQPPEQRHLLVRLQRDGAMADLLIADSGPGFAIDPDGDTLFRSTKAGGSGLGLFVVRTTLTNHHGRMRIGRSQALGGAEVRISLPLARSAGSEKYSPLLMVPSAPDSYGLQ